MGLTRSYSNYEILLEKVNQIKASISVEKASNRKLTDSPCSMESAVKILKQRQKHGFSKKETKEIVTAYQSGVSTYALAEQYNCHRNTIAKLLREQGIKVSKEKIDMDDAICMYESGSTTKEIAEKYHMSDNAVSRRLRMAGVRMRTRWDYKK